MERIYIYIYIYIYTLSYCHHQIGSMNYYPFLRLWSWNNGMRCMSLNILIPCIMSMTDHTPTPTPIQPPTHFNTLRPRQNGRHFPDDIFKWIFSNENVRISIYISLKFVLRGSINNIPTLVQVMAWRRPGYKPLSEPMMAKIPTHICITRPQWVKGGALRLFKQVICLLYIS